MSTSLPPCTERPVERTPDDFNKERKDHVLVNCPHLSDMALTSFTRTSYSLQHCQQVITSTHYIYWYYIVLHKTMLSSFQWLTAACTLKKSTLLLLPFRYCSVARTEFTIFSVRLRQGGSWGLRFSASLHKASQKWWQLILRWFGRCTN